MKSIVLIVSLLILDEYFTIASDYLLNLFEQNLIKKASPYWYPELSLSKWLSGYSGDLTDDKNLLECYFISPKLVRPSILVYDFL